MVARTSLSTSPSYVERLMQVQEFGSVRLSAISLAFATTRLCSSLLCLTAPQAQSLYFKCARGGFYKDGDAQVMSLVSPLAGREERIAGCTHHRSHLGEENGACELSGLWNFHWYPRRTERQYKTDALQTSECFHKGARSLSSRNMVSPTTRTSRPRSGPQSVST